MLSDMSSDSVKKFSDQVLNDPSSLLFASLADFYRENGLFQEALSICQNGLESHPENTEGRLVLAQCCRALGDIQQARTELTRVLKSHPENALAKKLLAELDRAGESTLEPAREKPEELAPESLTATEPLAVSPGPAPAEQVTEPPAEPAPEARASDQQPAPPMIEPPEEFHQGAKAMMVLAAESAGRAEPGEARAEILEYQEPSPASVTAAAEPPSPPAEPAREQPAPTAEESGAYARILGEVAKTPQVHSALLADESGYPVASALAPGAAPLDEEAAGALASLVFSIASQAMQKIKLGNLERAVIDTRNEKIFLSRAGSQVLSVAADSSAKVGLVAVNLKRAVERLNALSQQ